MNPPFTLAFNHDGSGILDELYDSPRTVDDVRRVLIQPVENSSIQVIDWCIKNTGMHNCRTRHQRGHRGQGSSDLHRRIGAVIQHFNAQEKDLLDLVIEAGHSAGLKVYGNVRLNHAGWDATELLSCPGRNAAGKKDFRDPLFHRYLCELFEDLLKKGVDGISLDFERKAPFFPEGASQEERYRACHRFLSAVRKLTEKPVVVRVSHERSKGAKEGQDPERWIEEGLVDGVIPATHNHEPDTLDWPFDRFLEAASKSPRRCLVWPQIWPTFASWGERAGSLHSHAAIASRVEAIRKSGADGAYFFNFCCFGSDSDYFELFRSLSRKETADR